MGEADLARQLLERLQVLNHASEELAASLQLPPDAKYDILAAMGSIQPAPLAERRREFAGQLLFGFVRERLQSQVARAEEIWNALADVPLIGLAADPRRSPSSQGIGFTRAGDGSLLSIISVVAWAVENTQSLREVDDDSRREALTTRAKEAGLNAAIRVALVNLLSARLRESPH